MDRYERHVALCRETHERLLGYLDLTEEEVPFRVPPRCRHWDGTEDCSPSSCLMLFGDVYITEEA